jgi:hypothetical protein
VVDVVGDEQSKACVDAALLEVLLEQDLEVLVEVVEGRAGVQRPPRPVLLGGLGVCELGVGEVVQVLDDEVAILCGGLDGECTLARALNADAGVRREALLALAVDLVVVLELLAVGRGNAVLGGDADVAVPGVTLVDGALGVGAARLYVHIGVVVHGLILECVLGVDVVVQVGGGEGDVDLLVTECAGQDNFLVAGLVLELRMISKLF